MPKPHVLFLCVHNSARSQIAEGLLRARASDRYEVFSAGSEPSRVHPLAIQVLRERGVDISTARSKNVREFLDAPIDVVITLCADEVCPVFPRPVTHLHWGLPDPSTVQGSEAERLNAFRCVADQLEQFIEQFVKRV